MPCPCAQHADPLPLRSLDCFLRGPQSQGAPSPHVTLVSTPYAPEARSLQPITSRPTTALAGKHCTAAPFRRPQCARPRRPHTKGGAQRRHHCPCSALSAQSPEPSPSSPGSHSGSGRGRKAGRLLSPWPRPFPPRTLPGVPRAGPPDAVSAGGSPEPSATAQNGAQCLPTGGSGHSSEQRMRTVPRTGEP